VRSVPRFRRLAAAIALALCACAAGTTPRAPGGSPVRDTHLSRSHESLQRIAVIPFTAVPGSADAVTLQTLAAHVAHALGARGLAVVPAGDVARAVASEGEVAPSLDPRGAAELAAREFGATSVLLGRVIRWREREGSAIGSTRPASVAFELTLFAAPLPRRLWSGNFDETQRSLTENLLRAQQYPGSGTRWLSASELAAWGAGELAKTLVE
jgi:hypothetical protein